VTSSPVFFIVLWMTGALTSFSASAIAVRLLSRTFSAFEMLAFRAGFALVLLLGLALVQPKLRAQLIPKKLSLHVVRNVVHFAGTYGWTVAVTILPLAMVFALEFTAPLWTAILAVLFLGERITLGRVVAVISGFIGVMIILRPGLEGLRLEGLIVLAAALAFAITAVITKHLTATQTTFTILVWMNLIQGPLNLMGAGEAFWLKVEPDHFIPLIALGVGGLASHFCLTNAYRYGDATVVMPLDFLRVPLIAIVGWQFFGERLDPLLLLGSLFIIGGILFNLRAESRRVAA
jgi:drug/metabolite transporter (DMT)-like permease